MAHDPLCLADPATDNSRCHYCVLIGKVRQDMLDKCISGIELWPVAALRQRTKLDGTKEPLRFLIDKADVLEVLHRLQEKP